LFCQKGQSAFSGELSDGRTVEETGLTLCVIIYGVGSTAEELGDWLSEHGLFLQDPVHCERNVLYHNPHLLCGEDDEPVMTFALKFHTPIVHAETAIAAPNLFEILNEDRELSETEQPGAVSTILRRLASNRLLQEFTETSRVIRSRL
jgi:hypothetical protein